MVTVRPDDDQEATLRNVASLTALLDQFAMCSPNMPPTPSTEITSFSLDDKPLPIPPVDESPCSSPTATLGQGTDASETSTVATLATTTTGISKREHALKELLTSEQAYASDLAFIRNVHIPMALGKFPIFVDKPVTQLRVSGKSAPFNVPRPLTPPGSSGSSSRTLSTASDSSSGSSNAGPPMTKDDVRIIFGNIAELAVFSDMFSERLQEALGDVLEDGKGEDTVGTLFLEVVSTVFLAFPVDTET